MTESSFFKWSNSSITLLYRATSILSSTNDSKQILHDFLTLLKQHFNAGAGSIQLMTDDALMNLISHFGITKEQANSIQHTPIDAHLFSFETDAIDEIQIRQNELGIKTLPPKQLCIPVRCKIKTLGVINLFVENKIEITEELAYLLLSLGAHLGEFFEREHIENKSRRQLIKDERNIIANELHDSLAQTLASMRFQLRILDQALQPVGDFMAFKTIESVEHALDEATTDLRQLIAHCRVPIQEQGLVPAVKRAVEKFRKDTNTHIVFQCNEQTLALPSNIELNAYRIVQEALANIKKHANAHIVRVLLNSDNNNIRILIENDGEGFDQSKIRSTEGKHLGLTIMQERAKHLGGELKIESEADEGTRVELNFNYVDKSNN
ncbi:Nitrate/nitrite sensor protein [hydrothermal vent metagenome]|uniref:histidine kinase n=1 Tax=hydrothermal vent metagenome TaxID=652676 RepID=A0A3B0WDC8_9ZZZZ